MSSKNNNDEMSSLNKKVQFKRIISYFKPFLPHLLLSIFFALLVNGAALAKPYIIKHVIDSYITKNIADYGAITNFAIIYFSIVLSGAVMAYFQTYLLNFIGQNIMHNIRIEIFNHVQRMSMSFFDKFSSGRILTRITNDVEALNDIYSGVIVNLIRDSFLIIGIIITMFLLDVKLALVSICCVPVIFVIVVIYKKAARKNFVNMKATIAHINSFMAENISGMKIVQIFHREKEKYEELLNLDKKFFKFSLTEVVLNSLCRPLVDIINNLTIAFVILVCASRIFTNELEIGVLYAFITYIKQFFEPIAEISEKYTSIQASFVSADRIFEILDNTEDQESLYTGRRIESLKGKIEFKNVWFAYDGENFVLKDVSFNVEPGESIAFVGATGSGKTTIISLIARFYTIQKGQILLDGIDINEYNLQDLRRYISVVLQDVFLFSGDIISNIRLKSTDISEEDIIKASQFVNADPFILSLDGGYHAQVAERGCTFSAGQRQLISFARAIVAEPSILVLDEATANIDTETEIVIQDALGKLQKGRTSLTIAHRLSTIQSADKIIVIHKGRIKEMGNHAELLQKHGMYSELYNNLKIPPVIDSVILAE